MINQSFCNYGNGFKATMGVSRKPGNLFTMIHTPLLIRIKVLSDVAPGKRYIRPHYIIAFWIKVFVMNTKEKWILCLPGKSQRLNGLNCCIAHRTRIMMLVDKPKELLKSLIWSFE